MSFDPVIAIQKILVSFLMGFLIGLERERRGAKRFMIAGVRTFPLVSVSGTVVYIISEEIGNYMLIIIGLLFSIALAILIAYIHYSMGVPGLTTSTIAFSTFLVGILVGMGQIAVAAVITVVTVLLGLERSLFKSIAENISQSELVEALEFIVIALIIYPLLPSGKIYGLIDLQWYVYIIIVISILSFMSFIAMRVLGVRGGSIISALLGGLVNSEATTLSLATRLGADPSLKRTLIAGVLVTNTTMLLRNVIIAMFSIRGVNEYIGHYFGIILPTIMTSLVISCYYVTKTMGEKARAIRIEIESPLGLKNAIKFSLIFLVLYVLTALVVSRFREAIYVLAIGGVVSGAAVISSIALMSASGLLDLKTAVIVSSLATILSYADKIFYVNPAGRELIKAVSKTVLIGIAPSLIVLIYYSFIL
ncbi:MAG: hypothetical protein DRN26_00465 [Thermoplasmata archaeon]|nr:MAG: hypothetical protein DRN26_00465 [Thermoplasmata archaeon]